jgi:hypothetical protein
MRITERVLLGDSTKRLAEIADASVDLILSDPPYNTRMTANDRAGVLPDRRKPAEASAWSWTRSSSRGDLSPTVASRFVCRAVVRGLLIAERVSGIGMNRRRLTSRGVDAVLEAGGNALRIFAPRRPLRTKIGSTLSASTIFG